MEEQSSEAPSFSVLSVHTPGFYTLSCAARLCQMFCLAFCYSTAVSFREILDSRNSQRVYPCPYWREQMLLYLKCTQHAIK